VLCAPRPRPPSATLFPYTTLFRSVAVDREAAEDRDEARVREAATLRGRVVPEHALDEIGGAFVEEAPARTAGGVAVQREVGAGEGAAVVDAAAAHPARVQAVADRDAVDLVR